MFKSLLLITKNNSHATSAGTESLTGQLLVFCFLLKVSYKAKMKVKLILDVWAEFPPLS